MCSAGLANAQTVPIAGTGWNENVVVGAGQTFANSGITATMDGGTAKSGNTWYALGQDTSASSTGLPMGTSISVADSTTGGDTYQFQASGTNNALFTIGNGAGPTTATYTLATPGYYPTLSLLAADGNGATTMSVLFTYANGSTSSTSFAPQDWFHNVNTAYDANGRISSTGYSNVNGGDPQLYYYDFTGLSTASPLVSIKFTTQSTSNTDTAIFGVSGYQLSTWNGSTSNVWSLSGTDANWGASPIGFANGSNAVFNSSGLNTSISIATAVQPASVLFTNGATPYTFSGAAISGSGAVTLSSSAGSVTFYNANTYTGATTISGGTLTLAGAGSLGAGGLYSGAIANSSLLVVNTSSNQTFGGVISGVGSLQQLGTGITTLTNANTYSGTTLIGGGTLALGSAGSINSTPTIAMASGSTFNVAANPSYALASGQTLTGTGSFTVTGSVSLSSGATLLSAGSGLFRTLNISGLTTNPGSTMNYDIGGSSQDLINVTNANSLSIKGGGIDLYQSNGTTPFTTPGTYTLMTYSGSLSGSPLNLSVLNNPLVGYDSYYFAATGGSLNVTISTNYWTGGGSAFNWSNSGNWNGGILPTNGQTLNFTGSVGTSNTNDLSSFNAAGLAFASGAGAFTLSGNSIQLSGPITNLSSSPQIIGLNIGLSGSTQAINATGGNITLGGVISDGGAGLGITVAAGTNTVYLTAANTFSGPTSVTSGTLNLSNGLALQNSAVSPSGIVFDRAGSQSFTFGGLSGSSNGTLTDNGGNAVALTIGNNNLPAAYSGALGGIGSLIKVGTATQTLSGNSTFNGGVTINGGALSVNSLSVGGTNSSALGEGPANSSGQTITFNGGMLTYTGGNTGTTGAASNSLMFNPNINLLSGGGTINLVQSSATGNYVGFAGTLTGSGNLTIIDTADTTNAPGNQLFFESDGTASPGPNPNFTGNIILGAGGNIQIRNNTYNPFGPTATVIINAGGILSSDKGNTYSTGIPNPIVLSGGTLSTQGASMNYSGPVTIASGFSSALGDYSGSTGGFTVSGNLSGSGTATTTGTTVVSLSGNNSSFSGTWNSATAVTSFSTSASGSPNALWVGNGSGFTANLATGGTISLGALSGNSGTISNGVASTTAIFSVGALGATTTFGGTFANGSGTTGLNLVGGNLTLTSANTATGPTTISGGTLQLGNGASSGSVSGNIANNSALVFNNPTLVLFGNVVSGSGSLTKTGPGTLAVTANQTYTGPTIINAGTLQANYVSPTLSGFGSTGTGWTLNGGPTVSGNVLTLTNGGTGESRTAWDNTKVSPTTGFTANFTYTEPSGSGGADGVTFCLQNSGLTATGGGGGSFAYVGISPSLAIEMNIYSGAGGGLGTAYSTGGVSGTTISPGSVPLGTSTDPINVTVSYNPTTSVLSWSMTDSLNPTETFSSSKTGVNLASILGSATAYVGFTGATGGIASTQTISNFTYVPSTPTIINNILPTGTALSIASSATYDMYGASQTVGSLAGAGTLTNSYGGAVAFTLGSDSSSQTFSGVLQNGSGTLSLVKVGSGSLTLASNNAFSGGTTFSGTVQLGVGASTGNIGSGSITNNGSLVLNRSDAGLTLAAPINGSGSLYQIGSGTTTISSNISYSGSTVVNNGTLVLAGNNTSAGGTSISGGTVVVGNGGATGSLGSGPVANNGALYFNRNDNLLNISAPISGSGSIYQTGGGILTLSGTNTISGSLNISSGTVNLNGPNNSLSSILVSSAGALAGKGSASAATATIADGGNIVAGYNGVGSLTLGGLSFSGGGGISVYNLGSITSSTTQAAINITGSNGLAFLSTNSGDEPIFNLNGAAPTSPGLQTFHLIHYSGSLQGNVATAESGLSVNLSNYALNNRASNPTLVYTDPGYIDLQYTNDFPIWTGAVNGNWDTQTTSNWKLASNGSTTTFYQLDNVVFNDTAGTKTVVSINGADVNPSSVTFLANTATYTINGSNAITGQGPVTLSGSGTVNIANANTYTGGTFLNAGLLNISNPSALGATDGVSLGNITFAGGSFDNTSGSAMTLVDNSTGNSYPINFNGSSRFVGSNPLNLGSGTVSLLSNSTINVSASTLTIGGPIVGAYGLTQAGAGTLLLTASSTYIGPTAVTGGTLQIGNGGPGASIASTSNVVLSAGAALVFNQGDSQSFGSPISGSGSVYQNGTGMLTLTSSNSYTGGTFVNNALLTLSAAGPLGTLAPNSNLTMNGGALFLAANDTLGNSTNAGNLTLTNSAVAIVTPGYRVTLGNVTMVGGGLTAESVGNGDGKGAYSLYGQLNATSDTNGVAAQINAPQISLENSNTVFNVTRGSQAPAQDLIVSSSISSYTSGNGLTLQGNGVALFTGNNSYNGGTTITGGTLQLGSSTALGVGTVSIGSSGVIDINGTSASVGALSGSGLVDNVTAGGTPTLSIGYGNTSGTFAGTIQNSTGTTTLAKIGSGTQYLTGSSTYTGGTNLNGGVLNFASSAALGYPVSSASLTFGGGTLQWGAGNSTDISSVVAPIPNGVSAGIDTNGNSVSFGTALTGSGGLTKAGAGTLTLTAPNTYTGVTNIVGGTLNVANATALQNSTVNVQANNSLAFSAPGPIFGGLSGSGGFSLGGAALTVGANNLATSFGGTISGSGSLTKTGAGTLIIGGAQTYSGPTVISSGFLSFGGFSGFSSNGAGWTVNQLGSYTSTPFVNNTLTLTDGVGNEARSAFLNTPVPVNASFTAHFTYADTNAGGADGVTFCLQNSGLSARGTTGGGLGYGGISPSVAIALNLYNNVNQTGYDTNGAVSFPTTVGSVNLHSEDPINVVVNYNASSQVLTWTLTDPVGGTTFSDSQAGVNLQSALGSSTAYLGFTGGDGGVTANQTITGFSFALATTAANNLLPVTSPLVMSGGTLDLYGASQTVGNLSGTSGAVTNGYAGSTSTLTVGTDNSTQVYSGVLQDGAGLLALAKVGTGTLTLSSSNAYSGGTTITGGVLQIGGASVLGTGAVVITSPGLLDVNGFNTSIGALSGNGTVDNVSAGGTPSLSIGLGNTSGTFSGTIQNTSGSLSVIKIGSGTYALAGSNTYSGSTQINAGILNFAQNSLPSTTNIIFGGGTLQWAASNTQDVSAVIAPITGTANLDVNGNNVTFASGLSGNGNLTLAGTNAGTLTLAASSSFSGTTNVTGGTLIVGHPLALSNSVVNLTVNNSVGFAVPAATFGGLTGGAKLNLGTTALSVGANNNNSNYGGTLSGNGSLTKVGAGTLTLTSTQAYAGTTTVANGVLQLAAPLTTQVSGFGSNTTGGTGIAFSAYTVSNGSWTVNGYSYDAGAANTPITGNVLDLTDGNGGNVTGNGSLRAAFYNNKVPVNTSFNTTFTYTASSGGANYDCGFTFILQNSGTGAYGYPGRGFGVAGSDPAGGSSAGSAISPSVDLAFDVFGGAEMGYNTNGGDTTNVSIFGGSSYTPGDPINMSVSYNAATQVLSWSGTDAGKSLTFSASQSVNLATTLTGTSAYIGFTGGSGYFTSNQTISNFSYGVLGSSGSNILPTTTLLAISNSGSFDLNGGTQTLVGVSDLVAGQGGSIINSNLSSPSILILTPTGSTTYSGSIVDSGSANAITLIVSGSGSQTLAGTNSFSGGTYVTDGTLVLDGAGSLLAGSSLTIGSAPGSGSGIILPASRAVGTPAPGLAPVPEPGTLVLLALGMLMFAGRFVAKRARR
jgi:autotransporter-associated beta strand protein